MSQIDAEWCDRCRYDAVDAEEPRIPECWAHLYAQLCLRCAREGRRRQAKYEYDQGDD